MKRITRQVREEAARICSARANDWAADIDASAIKLPEYSDNEDARSLAAGAFWQVPSKTLTWGHERFRDEWAEAESLLRTGWTPEGWK